MTAPSTSAILGPAAAHTSTGSSAALSPTEFALACSGIVTQLDGHTAHRALDHLVTDLLCSLGYGDGMAVFLAHVTPPHAQEAQAA